MAKIPDRCPSCQGRLIVSRLDCPQCNTSISGSFEGSAVSRLSPNDLSFVMLFVRTKGNLKEMERELGVSYWTIRRKLDEVVELLGRGGADDAPSEDIDLSQARRAVIGRLRRVDIAAGEAEEILKEIKARVQATKESPDADSAPNTYAIWKVEPAEAPKETDEDL